MSTMGRWLAVVFDGVENSVFVSQVLDPLLYKKSSGMINHLDVVSFEANKIGAERVVQPYLQDGIVFTFFKRLPFFGTFSLMIQALQLAWFLRGRNYEFIQVRGALAGYITSTAIEILNFFGKSFKYTSVVVQARGVAAEEARMAVQMDENAGIVRRLLLPFRCAQLRKIEAMAYDSRQWLLDVQVASVSSALIDYLVGNYGITRGHCFIDESDIPQHIEAGQVRMWRKEGRTLLGIPLNATVYLYSGSHKAWQCGKETMALIAEKLAEDKEAFGVIFSGDSKAFETLASELLVDRKRLIITTVSSRELIKWLAIGDFGILLRTKDPVNWVSRPTKALEYLAVGLNVIHNDTVKWLIDYEAEKGISGMAITPQPRHTSLS